MQSALAQSPGVQGGGSRAAANLIRSERVSGKLSGVFGQSSGSISAQGGAGSMNQSQMMMRTASPDVLMGGEQMTTQNNLFNVSNLGGVSNQTLSKNPTPTRSFLKNSS